ncbi:MAG: exodeoxyribonuclease VII small subunit [Chloroflexi bacterium]|nr:exodeoxyribonuclease VII small subunit [Chloroflexota bacterium]
MKKTNQPTFEANYKRLEEVVTLLDAGKLSLGEMLALYEEGIKLARLCEKQLEEAELKVSQLQIDQEADEDEPAQQLL